MKNMTLYRDVILYHNKYTRGEKDDVMRRCYEKYDVI